MFSAAFFWRCLARLVIVAPMIMMTLATSPGLLVSEQ
jgi:hypothetical protein